MKIKWIDNVNHCINSTKDKDVLTISQLVEEIKPRVTEGLHDILKRQWPNGKIFINKNRGECPRFNLRTKPLRKSVIINDPERIIYEPMGFAIVLYDDEGVHVDDKKIWLDFKRNPSHVILVTLFKGEPADLFVFPLS